MFLCTFCFQTHYGIYFFNFHLFYDQCKGKLAKILQDLQTHLFVPLDQEKRDLLIKAITPKRLTARSLNPNSIQKLLKHSFNSFVCLAHHFKRIPHIQEVINRNFCFDDPFFCYWFLYINNQDPNDTKACNLLLNQNVSSFCDQLKIHHDSYHILNHQEILKLASKEVFEIGDGNIEVTLSTYDY